MGNIESKRLIFNVGVFSATAAAFVYIWLGPKPGRRSSRDIWEPPNLSTVDIRGYYNLGNSCYINSLLQALAASRHNVRYINNFYKLKQMCCQDNENNPAFRIVSALAASNQYINRDVLEISAELSRQIPKNVISTFTEWSQVSLVTHEEQDVHEFFNTIMTAMLEEQKTLQARPDFLDAVRNLEDSSLSFSYSLIDEPEPISSASGRSSPDLIASGDGKGIANILGGKNSKRTYIITRGSLTEVPCCPATPADLIDWNSPFVGRFASSLQCISCQTTLPIKFEEFTDLTLTLPSKVTPTLRDLIEHYFVPAVVHSVDCPDCSNRASKPIKSSFYKRTCISKFPRSLCIHVNRVQWGVNGRSEKRFDFIPFPIVLDMSMVSSLSDLMKTELNQGRLLGNGLGPFGLGAGAFGLGAGAFGIGVGSFVLEAGEPKPASKLPPSGSRYFPKYELMAVVCHRGNIDTGHFIAYRRSPSKSITGEEWYMVSDTYIRPVMEEQVLLQHAYMLFYDRIETD